MRRFSSNPEESFENVNEDLRGLRERVPRNLRNSFQKSESGYLLSDFWKLFLEILGSSGRDLQGAIFKKEVKEEFRKIQGRVQRDFQEFQVL